MLEASRVSSSVDLSKSLFRGSGAMYQTDRLTLGRSKFTVQGTPQVIEKVVYKDNENSLKTIQDLQERLKEALLRSVLLSTQVNYLQKKLERQSSQANSQKVFENNFAFDNQRLKAEVTRLSQLMADKDREIQFVREAEIRKSAIHTGELTVRLGILTKENQRLQNAQLEKISQMNNLNSDLHKERQQRSTLSLAQSSQARLADLERLVQEKDRQIYELKVSHGSEMSSKEAAIRSITEKLTTAEHNLRQKDSIVKDMSASSSETANLKDVVASLRSELNRRTSQVASLESKKQELEKNQTQAAILTADLEALKNENMKLSERVMEEKSIAGKLVDQLREKENEIVKLSSKLRVEEELTRHEKKKLEQKMQEFASEENKTIKYYEEEIEKVRKSVAAKDNSVTEKVRLLEGQLAMTNAKNHALSSDLSQTLMKLKTLEAQHEEQQSELSSLRKSRQITETDLQNQLRRQANDHAIELEDQRATLAIDRRQWQAKEADMLAEIDRLTREQEKMVVDGVAKEQRRLIAEREKDQAEFDQAIRQERENRLKVDQEIHDLQVKKINLGRENTELREALNEASDKLKGCEAIIHRNNFLEKELLEKGSKLEKINRTLDEFQSTIDRDQQTHIAATNKIRHQRDRAEKELELANQEISKLQALIDNHGNILHDTESQWQNRLNQLENKMQGQSRPSSSNQASTIRKLQDDYDKAVSELTNSQRLCSSLQEEMDKLKNDLDMRNRTVESLQIQMKSNSRDPSMIDLTSDAQVKEIDELQNRFKEALTQLGFVRLSAQRLENEVEHIRKENKKLKQALTEGLSGDISRRDISNQSIDLTGHQEGRSRLNSGNFTVNEITAGLDKATIRMEQLQKELLDCKSDYFAVLKSKKDQAKLLDNYRDQLSRATEETSRANIELVAAHEKISRLELEIARLHQLSNRVQQEHFFEISTSERYRGSDSPRMSQALELKDDLLREAQKNLDDLNAKLDRSMAEKSRFAVLNANITSELTRLRRKEEEARVEVEQLQKENSDLRREYSAMKVRLLNLESKASVQALNYEELLKEKEEELNQRYLLIDQLSKDCDGLINRMKNSDTEQSHRDKPLDKALKENIALVEELKSRKDSERLLREEVIQLRELLAKSQIPGADGDSYASIMHACALKERQLQLKINTLEKKCIDLEDDLRDAKTAAKRESVYREEAERFRLMYNDAQRELIKMKDDMEARGLLTSPYRSKISPKIYHSPPRKQFASSTLNRNRESGGSKPSPQQESPLRTPNRSQKQLESPGSNYRLRENNTSYGN